MWWCGRLQDNFYALISTLKMIKMKSYCQRMVFQISMHSTWSCECTEHALCSINDRTSVEDVQWGKEHRLEMFSKQENNFDNVFWETNIFGCFLCISPLWQNGSILFIFQVNRSTQNKQYSCTFLQKTERIRWYLAFVRDPTLTIQSSYQELIELER